MDGHVFFFWSTCVRVHTVLVYWGALATCMWIKINNVKYSQLRLDIACRHVATVDKHPITMDNIVLMRVSVDRTEEIKDIVEFFYCHGYIKRFLLKMHVSKSLLHFWADK